MAVFERSFQITDDVPLSFQVARDVIFSGAYLRSCQGDLLLQTLCQLDSESDISVLRSFIASDQKENDCRPKLGEVHAVPRPVMNPQLRNAAAHPSNVAGKSERQSLDSGFNTVLCVQIPNPIQPLRELRCFPDLDQV